MAGFLEDDELELLVVVEVLRLWAHFRLQFVKVHQYQFLPAVELIARLDTLVVLLVDVLHEFAVRRGQLAHERGLADWGLLELVGIHIGPILRLVGKQLSLKPAEDMLDGVLAQLAGLLGRGRLNLVDLTVCPLQAIQKHLVFVCAEEIAQLFAVFNLLAILSLPFGLRRFCLLRLGLMSLAGALLSVVALLIVHEVVKAGSEVRLEPVLHTLLED